MTESQYRRANRTVLSVVIVILVYFIFIMGVSALVSKGDSQPYIRVLASVLMLVGTIMSYVLWKDQKKGAIGMMVCATIAYVVMVLIGTEQAHMHMLSPYCSAPWHIITESCLLWVM